MSKTCHICSFWQVVERFKPNSFSRPVPLEGCSLGTCLTVEESHCDKFAPLPSVALSVRQPYAHLIVAGLKDVENRSRRTHYRGPVLIHASAFTMSRAAWMNFVDWAFSNSLKNIVTDHPTLMFRGGIIGVADIVDCVSESDSPWFNGPWGWKLANARPLPFKACKGALGFFKVDYASL